MTFKEYLIKQGIEEDTASKIEAGMAEEKLFIANEENLDRRYNQSKEQLAQYKADLTDAQATITKLQKSNKDNEDLQSQITDYKQRAEQAEIERAKALKEFTIKDALRDAGAKDVDYMMFKLGDLEVDKDGNIKELENKVKSLKEASPDFFNADKPAVDNGDGYKPLDTKLETGNANDDPESSAQAAFEAALGIKE